MSKSENHYSPALEFILLCWQRAPRKSWDRLNHAMYGATRIAIHSGMRFEPEDFAVLAAQTRSHRWIMNAGEGLYSEACGAERGTENLSAAIAMEASYFPRPAFIWAEEVKTPSRLSVGSRFTWQGLRVKVTSIHKDSLVACSYKDANEGEIDRRFNISLEALAAKRKDYDSRRKAIEKQIAECPNREAVKSLRAELVKGSTLDDFRPFDIELIQASLRAKEEAAK